MSRTRTQRTARTRSAAAKGAKAKVQPLRRVLVATDFSARSSWAVARAGLLPLAEDARIELLAVMAAPPKGPGQRDLVEDARRRIERGAARVRAAVRERGHQRVEVSTRVVVGQPFVEIVRAAREFDAELIVLGKHGQRPLRDLLMGSTVKKVIHYGDVPVLVVAKKPTQGYRRPLLATALDDASARTLWLANRLTERVSAGTLLHAYEVPFAGFVAPAREARERADWEREGRAQAEAALRAFVARQGDAAAAWKPLARLGDPRSLIAAEVTRRRSDLLALGTHARSGIAHALLGSIAEWMLERAPCDVLIARPIRFSFELP